MNCILKNIVLKCKEIFNQQCKCYNVDIIILFRIVVLFLVVEYELNMLMVCCRRKHTEA